MSTAKHVAFSLIILSLIGTDDVLAASDTCCCSVNKQDSRYRTTPTSSNMPKSQVLGNQDISICIPINANASTNPTKEDNHEALRGSYPKNARIDEQALAERYQSIITALLAFVGVIATIYYASHRERSNIIRKARIEWAQSLRQLFSEFSVLAEQVFMEMRIELIKRDGSEAKESVREIFGKSLDKVGRVEGLANNIILHLNPDENKHRELKRLIARIRGSLSYESLINGKFDTDSVEDSIHEAALVIKEAWEQAKK